MQDELDDLDIEIPEEKGEGILVFQAVDRDGVVGILEKLDVEIVNKGETSLRYKIDKYKFYVIATGKTKDMKRECATEKREIKKDVPLESGHVLFICEKK